MRVKMFQERVHAKHRLRGPFPKGAPFQYALARANGSRLRPVDTRNVVSSNPNVLGGTPVFHWNAPFGEEPDRLPGGWALARGVPRRLPVSYPATGSCRTRTRSRGAGEHCWRFSMNLYLVAGTPGTSGSHRPAAGLVRVRKRGVARSCRGCGIHGVHHSRSELAIPAEFESPKDAHRSSRGAQEHHRRIQATRSSDSRCSSRNARGLTGRG